MTQSFTEIITKYKNFLDEIASCDREILRSQRNLKVNTNRQPRIEGEIVELEQKRKNLIESKKAEANVQLAKALRNNHISIDQDLFYNGMEVCLANIIVNFMGEDFTLFKDNISLASGISEYETQRFINMIMPRIMNINYSDDFKKLQEMYRLLNINEDKVRFVLVERLMKKDENKYRKLIDNARTNKELAIGAKYAVDEALRDKAPVKPTIFNKLIHSNQLKMQTRQAELEEEILGYDDTINKYELAISEIPSKESSYANSVNISLTTLKAIMNFVNTLEQIKQDIKYFDNTEVVAANEKLEKVKYSITNDETNIAYMQNKKKRFEKEVKEYLAKYFSRKEFVDMLLSTNPNRYPEEIRPYIAMVREAYQNHTIEQVDTILDN